MNRCVLHFFPLLLCTALVRGQSLDCGNIGFEQGTANGWRLTNGVVAAVNRQTVYESETAGTFENGHLVTSLSNGNDPLITAEAIPMVAPGSTHSIRIGNVTRGSRFDRVVGSFKVTADNTLFQYQFAVVLQLPNHEPYQQPGFSVRITNQNGATLACSEYDVTAAVSISGFKEQGDLRYRNWTTGAIDLRAYIGQTVNVDVTAHGCTERRHFGYAYFDAQCLKTEVTAALFCPGVDELMTLKAPAGFAAYTWNTGETTTDIRIRPKQGDRYQVTVIPYSSLDNACHLQLDHTVQVGKPVEPARQTASICEGDGYRVGDSTYRTAGTYLTPIKRGALLCDSLVQTTLAVRPLARSSQSMTLCAGNSLQVGTTTYQTSGTYQTRISRSGSRCDSVVTTRLTISPFDLTITPSVFIHPGESVPLRATLVSGAGTVQLQWLPAGGLSCTTCPDPKASPTETTRYTLLAENTTLGCSRTASVVVSVGNCVIYVPDAFTPNGDGANDVFMIPATTCIRQINELTIYDRWGEVIYQCEIVAAGEPIYGWNGRYQGLDAGAGMYAYKAEVSLLDGVVSQFRGRILLIR